MKMNLIYIAWGHHIPLARKSARSFLKHNPTLIEEVILLVPNAEAKKKNDSDLETSPFSLIRTFNSTPDWHLNKPFALREYLAEHYGKNHTYLFVDNDTICCEPINGLISFAAKFPLAAALAPDYSLETFAGDSLPKIFPDTFQASPGMTCFNTGVILMNTKTSVIDSIMNEWIRLATIGKEIDQHDQGYFSLACFNLGISPYPLIPNYNHRNRGPCSGKIYIHHSYNEPPKRPTLRYPGLFYNDFPGAQPISMSFLMDRNVVNWLRRFEKFYNLIHQLNLKRAKSSPQER